ncbi:hypothetical protein NIES25_69910 (plasmid) [Nostoc linckia NIES-25]|nr:hypothetical protein NIES25_69910 [Nostoc linckia NIES-25]
MAHKRERDKARELYQKGFYPPDIAAQLKVPLRSVQRWLKGFREESGANSQEENSSITLLEESSGLIAGTPQKPNLPKLESQSEAWFNEVSSLANELLTTHSKIRKKLVELLETKLEDPDLNLRLVQGLSQSICRHSEREEAISSLGLLDINKAYVLVEKYGFAVIDPNFKEDEQS